MAKVICVGCGTMGGRLIQALIDEKHDVTIVNRTAGKAAPFACQGVNCCATLSQAVERSGAEIIIINVSDYGAGTEIISSCPDAIKGRIVVNLSTGEAVKVASFAALVHQLGGRFVCGVLTCYPKNIGARGDGSIVFAGDEESYSKIRDVLDSLSPANFFVGTDPTLAPVFDTAWLASHYGLIWGVLQGAASCKQRGIDMSLYAGAMKEMITALMGVLCSNIENTVAKDYYPVASDSAVDMHIAGMQEVISGLERSGFDPTPLVGVKLLAQKAAAGGDGDKDIGILVKYMD